MFIRPLQLVVAVLLLPGADLAVAQPSGPRTDILTGEPIRPHTAHPRPEPEIFNAPHAPLQPPGRMGSNPPMEIYVTPQIGVGAAAGPLSRGSIQQQPRYPRRLPQERPY